MAEEKKMEPNQTRPLFNPNFNQNSRPIFNWGSTPNLDYPSKQPIISDETAEKYIGDLTCFVSKSTLNESPTFFELWTDVFPKTPVPSLQNCTVKQLENISIFLDEFTRANTEMLPGSSHILGTFIYNKPKFPPYIMLLTEDFGFVDTNYYALCRNNTEKHLSKPAYDEFKQVITPQIQQSMAQYLTEESYADWQQDATIRNQKIQLIKKIANDLLKR